MKQHFLHFNPAFSPVIMVLILWGSLTLNLYLFVFQPVHTVSRVQLGLSGLVAGGMVMLLLTWYQRENAPALHVPIRWGALFALWTTGLVFLGKPQPSMAIFALPERVEVTFTPLQDNATSALVTWMHNGVSDVSFQQVNWLGGAQIQSDGVRLELSKDHLGGLHWEGKGWRTLTLTLKSEVPLLAEVSTRHTHMDMIIEPASPSERAVHIPIGDPQFARVIQTAMWGNVFLSFFLSMWVGTAVPREKRFHLPSPRWQDFLPWVPLIFLTGLGWVVGMVTAQYNRLYVDDYCYLNLLNQKGWAGANVHAYLHITGRFAAHALDFVAYHLDERIAPLGIFVLFTAGGGALYLLMRTLYPVAKGWQTAGMAWALPLFALITTANPVQSVFWTLHALSVCAGLGFLLLTFRAVFRMIPSPASVKERIGLFLLALFTGGFHETLSIAGILLLTLTTWLEWRTRKGENRFSMPVSAVAVLGLICGTLIVALAPGNTSRMAEIGYSLTLKEILFQTGDLIRSSFHWMLGGPDQSGFPLMILLVVFLLGIQWGRRYSIPSLGFAPLHPLEKIILFFLPVFSILIMLLPSAVLMGYFPLRSLFIPQMVLISAAFGHGVWAGEWLRKQNTHLLIPVSVFTVGVLLWAGWLIYPAVTTFHWEMRLHAAEWDARVNLITQAREAGKPEVIVPPYRHIAEVDLQPDPNHWLNQCVQDYYGIRVQIQTPDEP